MMRKKNIDQSEMDKEGAEKVKQEKNFTPFEEINQLNERLKKIKEITLEGTDLEYFSKEQLVELNKITNELAALSFKMIVSMEGEGEEW